MRLLRYVIILVCLGASLYGGRLLHLRYSVLPKAGFPTWEAVFNHEFRVGKGQVVIELPEDFPMEDFRIPRENGTGSYSIDGRSITWRPVFRGVLPLYFAFKKDGIEHEYDFVVVMPNSWDRIDIRPIDAQSVEPGFAAKMNGVELADFKHLQIIRTISTVSPDGIPDYRTQRWDPSTAVSWHETP